MRFKRSGKTIFGVDLSPSEERAIDKEIERRLAVYSRKHNIEFAAMVLYELHEQFGFGETRLRRFYDGFDKDLSDLIDRYEMTDDDMSWLCTYKLKEKGIDVAKWHDENEAAWKGE